MPRCTPHPFATLRQIARTLAFAATSATIGVAALPATAQNTSPMALSGQRNFPEAALRGVLVVTSATTAEINGNAVHMAPGMRLFTPQNGLVMLHTAVGQKYTVNYLMEQSTGMLLTAWILSTEEAAQKRAGATETSHNYNTGASAQ